MLCRAVTVLVLLSVLTPASGSAAEVKRLKLEQLLDWESVSGPQLSPDGEQICFVRSWTDKVNDRRQSELWMMNADGSRARFLVEGSSPQWSPDGSRIAYLASGKPNGTQVYVMWVDTRESTQITHVTESPSGVRWSPDGSHLAFNMQVPEKEGFSIQLPSRPKGANWAPDPRVITRLTYRRDRRGYVPTGFRHIFVMDSGGGTPRRITTGDFDHSGPRWSADGGSIYFSGLRAADADWQVRESEVYAVALENGEISQLTNREGPDGSPVPSPDGKHIAYVGSDKTTDTYTVPQIYVMRPDGTEPRSLTPEFDRRPGSLHWAADGSAVYFSSSSEGQTHVYRVDLSGNVTQLTEGDRQFTLSDVGRDGVLTGTYRSAHEPGDVFIQRPAADPVRLTRVNDDLLHGVTLGEVEEIRYKSVGGLEIQGWIVKPPGFDPQRKYPMMLQIHGGPHGMYGIGFDFERQNHAANDFVVLYTNPRGSAGYGKEFGNAINNAYPGEDYDDLMAGVDHVLAQGYVDKDNLFVFGGSGGGVLTCWTVGHTDRFRAAVSMFPVTNWISFVGTTDGPYWYSNFRKRPWEDITEHWERSPLKYVGNVTTPTMLITGELDLRTPMSQTEEYYQALRLRKVDSVMVRVPDEYHGAAGRHVSNRLRRILYVRGWFNKYRTNK